VKRRGKMILGLIGVAIGSVMPIDYPPTTVTEKTVVCDYPEWNPYAEEPERPHLTKSGGVFAGPSGKETYYNLPMGTVISNMRAMGYTVEEYPYWVRQDGAKMLGDYVMCAANLSTRPKGTILETSLGKAIVVDTGGFVKSNPNALDMATDW
jgi:hypothetical protein